MQFVVETGLQLFSRLNSRAEFVDQNLFSDRLKNGETVEISGNLSSGKTFLVTHLLANCILPTTTSEEVPIGGQNNEAILVDNNHHFRILTMVKIMRFKILESYKSVNKTVNEETISKIIKSSLKNLRVINCYDRLQFRLTVLSFENLLLHNRNIVLIVVDGIAAFYWEDRDQESIWQKDSYLKSILNLVQKYTTVLHKVALIYTISNDFMPDDKHYLAWSSVEHTEHRVNLFLSDTKEFYGIIRSKNCEERIFRYEIGDDGWKWI